MRHLVMAMVALCCATQAAYSQDKELPMEKGFDLPKFIDPLKLSGADEMPAGELWIDEEKQAVCYDKDKHTRLLLTLKAIEPASDLRATQSFNAGYTAGFADGGQEAAKVASEPALSYVQNAIMWLAVGASTTLIIMELVK
jgi:hypothetical protein